MIAETVFWAAVGLIAYTYAGYPVMLALVSRLSRRPVKKQSYEPRVSVILSAFNEQRYIEEKIANLLSLDYPREKIEILIGSDGGSDETDLIISRVKDPRVRFFRFVRNQGKPHVINGLVNESRGAILVFTDSRQRFERSALRELADNFADPEVGCVSGELLFEAVKGSGVAQGMDAYWKYEKVLRKMESDMGSMLGATGAIYAVRRRLFVPLPHDMLVDDMFTPLAIVQRGYRAVFDKSARAYDSASQKGSEEFTRKIRTLMGNYQIFQHFPQLFIPFKSPVAWQLFSHKFLRLMVPFLQIAAMAANIALFREPFYAIVLAGQALFYGLALIELLGEKLFSWRRGIGYIPYMFCILNYSAFAAFFRYIKGGDRARVWRKAYQ